MIREISDENNELIERSERLNKQLKKIADKVEELKFEKIQIEHENAKLKMRLKTGE